MVPVNNEAYIKFFISINKYIFQIIDLLFLFHFFINIYKFLLFYIGYID